MGIIGQRIPHFDSEAMQGLQKCAIEAACPNKVAKVVDGKPHIDEVELLQTLRKVCGKMSIPFHPGRYLRIQDLYRWTLGKEISHGKALNRIFTSEEEALDVIEKAILLLRTRDLKENVLPRL